MLDKYGYKHKIITFNTFCPSTATMVTRAGLHVKFVSKFSGLLFSALLIVSESKIYGIPSNQSWLIGTGKMIPDCR
jgi:hypothetical protein